VRDWNVLCKKQRGGALNVTDQRAKVNSLGGTTDIICDGVLEDTNEEQNDRGVDRIMGIIQRTKITSMARDNLEKMRQFRNRLA